MDSIEHPIRSSTPAPSVDSTIMAGHLDYSISMDEHLDDTESTNEDTEIDEILQPYREKCKKNTWQMKEAKWPDNAETSEKN